MEEKENEIIISIDEFERLEKEGDKIKIVLGKKISKERKKEIKKEKKEEKREKEKTEREILKEELNIFDFKKEFRKHLESLKSEEEKLKEMKEREKKKFKFFENLSKRFRKKKYFVDVLKEKTLREIENTKYLEDNKKQVIAIATILNDFVEIYLGEERELTYKELAEALEKKEMKDEIIKNKLIDFFNRIGIEEYQGKISEDPEELRRFAIEVVNSLYPEMKKRKDLNIPIE